MGTEGVDLDVTPQYLSWSVWRKGQTRSRCVRGIWRSLSNPHRIFRSLFVSVGTHEIFIGVWFPRNTQDFPRSLVSLGPRSPLSFYSSIGTFFRGPYSGRGVLSTFYFWKSNTYYIRLIKVRLSFWLHGIIIKGESIQEIIDVLHTKKKWGPQIRLVVTQWLKIKR